MPQSVGDLLYRTATRAPDRIALTEGGADPTPRRWTYAQLLADAQQWARALLHRLPAGSRVAVWAPNIPEYQIAQYAIALAGMVMVTVNPAFRRDEARYVLAHAEVSACLTVPGFRGRPLRPVAGQLAAELPALQWVVDLTDPRELLAGADATADLPPVDPTGPALILYTSGTTGAPKGAVLSHHTLTSTAPLAARRIVAGRYDEVVWLAALPMFHLAGCVMAAIGTLSLAGNLVTVRSFDAGLVLRLIAAERVSTGNLVPTLMWALLRHPDFGRTDLSSLHSMMLGGATVPPTLARQVRDLGVVPIVAYGMTEAVCISATEAGDPVTDIVETCGRPLPGVEVRTRDPHTGQECAPGELGELYTRGSHTLLEYFRDPAATAAAIDADGWFRTGDLATIDQRGVIRIGGRASDMIIRGGENVYPREVEDRLLAEEGVHGAAVVGLPDDYYGEIVAAFIQRSPGSKVTATHLRDRLRATLSGYKVPSAWFFVDSYPQTASGKIQKFVLRDRWLRGEYTEEPLTADGSPDRQPSTT